MTNGIGAAAGQHVQLQPNHTTEISVAAGQNVAIDGNLQVQGAAMGPAGSLILHFSNGATLIIKNFADVAVMQPSPVLSLPHGHDIVLSQFQPSQFTAQETHSAAQQNAEEIVIAKPKADQNVVVTLEHGHEYKFGFALSEAKSVVNKDGQLVISFKNGGGVIIPNYGTGAHGADGVQLHLKNGAEMASVPLTHQDNANMADAAQKLAEVEPAAGDNGGGPASGGFGFQSVFQADPINSLSAIGPIDPTALRYVAPDALPNVVPGILPPPPIVPSLSALSQWVKEDGSVALSIDATPSNANEQIKLTVTGFLPGWTVNTAASGGTYDSATHTWTITLAPGASFHGGPTVSPPHDSDLDMTGLVVTEDVHNVVTGQTASATAGFDVWTDAVIDAPAITAANAAGPEDAPVALSISVNAGGDTADHSETLSNVTISGVPAGATLNHGTFNAGTGTWTLTPAQLTGLTLTPPSHFSGTINLHVSVTDSENVTLTTPGNAEQTLADNTATANADIVVTINNIIDKPSLTVHDAWVKEDGAVAPGFTGQLSIDASLTNPGPADHLVISVSGFQNGWTFTNLAGGAYDAATHTWSITLAPGASFHGGPTVVPPADSDLDMTGLQVTATATDGTVSATSTATESVFTDAVIDAPSVTASNASGNEDSPIALAISVSAGGDTADHSETLSNVTISGVPAGAHLSAGTFNAGTGNWTLTPAQLTGLTLTPPSHFSGTINLHVSVTDSENVTLATPGNAEQTLADNTATATADLTVTVSNLIDKPTLTVQDVWVKEDSSAVATNHLNINAHLNNPGPNDQLTVTVAGFLPGWGVDTSASGGTYNAATHTWSITLPAGVTSFSGGPTVVPPHDSDLDMTGLQVTATASDGTVSATTLPATENVFTDAVIDAPSITASNASGAEGAPVALSITANPGGDTADHSETLSNVTITLTGAPAGTTLNHGTETAPGVWTMTAAQLAGLQLNPPAHFSGTINVHVSVTDSENVTLTTPGNAEQTLADNTATANADLTVSITNLIDKPTLTVHDIWVKEDSSAVATNHLNISANLNNPGPNDQLTVTVAGFLPGWGVDTSASGGVYNAATHTWSITLPAGVTSFSGGPTVIPPHDSDLDMTTLVVTATASDGVVSATTLPATESVFVDAVIDGPSVNASNASGSDNGPIAVSASINHGGDADGSEQITNVTVTLTGAPAGTTLNHGHETVAGSGIWTLTEAELSGLTVTAPRGFDGSFSLTVKATEAEQVTLTTPGNAEQTLTDNTATAEKTITVTVHDDIPNIVTVNPNPAIVDETGLATANQVINGAITADYHTDTPGAISATGAASFGSSGSRLGGALTSHGDAVTVTAAGNTYTGTAAGKEIFTFVLQPGGQYTFTLKGVLDHANASDPNDIINLAFGVTATDSDGDTATGIVTVQVKDDAPIAFNDANTWVVGGGAASGNVVTNDTISQDKPDLVSSVSFGGTAHAITSGGTTTVAGAHGTLVLGSDGHYTYTPSSAATAFVGHAQTYSDDFTYTLKDADGDVSTAHLTVTGQPPCFIVGKNVNDTTGSGTTYQVGDGTGVITGGAAGDVLVGDIGGSSLQNQNKDYNIVLILDVSGSMAGDKIALLKSAVNNLITSFHNYAGGTVKIDIIPFSDQAQTSHSYTVNGADATGFNAAQAFVNGFVANGFTNYEDPMQTAVNYLNSTQKIAGADTFTYFVSDGQPNHYVSGTNHSVDAGDNNAGRIRVMNEIQGIGENTANDGDGTQNEVAALKSLSTDVTAVGIGVDTATIQNLNVIDKDGHALDVHNPNDLSAALQGASPLNKLAAVGGDHIVAGDGNDLIFGDSLNTDALAVAQHLTTSPGASWDVFAQLQASHGWTQQQVIDYIKANATALGGETLDSSGAHRTGGNDTLEGGAGNDIIFGQEGNDLIDGGSGSNTLSGGSGADTFHIGHAPVAGQVDTIKDFSTAQGDVLDVRDILVGFDPLHSNIHNFVSTTTAGGNTTVAVDATGGGHFQAVAVLEGVNIDVDTLTNHGNLIA